MISRTTATGFTRKMTVKMLCVCGLIIKLCLIRRWLAEHRTSFSTEMSEAPQTRTFDSVHITLNVETGSLLPLALR